MSRIWKLDQFVAARYVGGHGRAGSLRKVKTDDFSLIWTRGKWKDNGGNADFYLTLSKASDNSSRLMAKMDAVVAALLDIIESEWADDTLAGETTDFDHLWVCVQNETDPRFPMEFARYFKNMTGAVLADALKAHCGNVIDKMLEVSIDVYFNENMMAGAEDDEIQYGNWYGGDYERHEYDDLKHKPALFGVVNENAGV